MFIYLVYYFLGIYLTIAEYAFLPKNNSRLYIMFGIHLIFTLPSSFFLANEVLKSSQVEKNNFYIFILTLLLATISVLLSGIIVNKIK